MGSMHLGFECADEGERAAAFYTERARGGASLIITGGCAVTRAGAGGRHYALINETHHAPFLSCMVEAVHREHGCLALQLFHAGRYASREAFDLEPVAPSLVPSRFSLAPPREFTSEEVLEAVADFARGASRARELGFDAIEVMGSEGYLLNQFVSPLTNRRDDEWGGDSERRTRFPLSVVRSIRDTVGRGFPVIYRLSVADLMPGSSTADEIAVLARRLVEAGVDALSMGVGWHESSVPTVQYTVPPGAWLEYAAQLKRAVDASVPIIAGTRIPTVEWAERALRSGSADFVALARPFLADAAIVAKSRRGQAARVNHCIACNQACIDRSLKDRAVSCMVNPRAGREIEWPDETTACPGRFAVVGGGPAGLEAARVLATLGHEVVLYEARAALGGQFRLACRVPGKADFARTIEYFEYELTRLDVLIRLNEAITARNISGLLEFDGVVVATGVRPREVQLPGVENPIVRSYPQALLEDGDTSGPVAIIGAGGIGVDLAHRFSSQQRAVTLMCRGAVIGEHIGRSTRWVILNALRASGVEILTRVAYERIESTGVWIRDREGLRRFVAAARVVVAAGQDRHDGLSEELRRRGCRLRVVGGAREASQVNAVRAFAEGAVAARDLDAEHARKRILPKRGPAVSGKSVDEVRPTGDSA